MTNELIIALLIGIFPQAKQIAINIFHILVDLFYIHSCKCTSLYAKKKINMSKKLVWAIEMFYSFRNLFILLRRIHFFFFNATHFLLKCDKQNIIPFIKRTYRCLKCLLTIIIFYVNFINQNKRTLHLINTFKNKGNFETITNL